MPVTPDVIISKPLKFLHDSLMTIGLLLTVLTIVAFNNGGNFILLGLMSAGSIYLGSKVKYKLVKNMQIDSYKRV